MGGVILLLQKTIETADQIAGVHDWNCMCNECYVKKYQQMQPEQNQKQKANSSKTPMENLVEQLPQNWQRDYRVVPRRLLEHCLGVIEYFNNKYNIIGSDNDTTLAISQLKTALAIEKEELKTPFEIKKPCDEYHQVGWIEICTKCGISKLLHNTNK